MNQLIMLLGLVWVGLGPCYAQTYQLNRSALPLMEIGVGLGHADIPQYEGAKERRYFTIPFPTLIYRGDVVRADEDGGPRSRMKFSDDLEINASFGASIPVESDSIEVREGMPDLDALLELGPGLIYHAIHSSKERPYSITVSLGTRYAFTTDLDYTRGRGWIFSPNVFGRIKINDQWSSFLSVSQKWAEKSYQQYYYDVPDRYATSDRPVYESSGGVISSRLAGFFAYQPSDKFAWVTGLVYTNYHNASNRLSPLHVEDENYSLILGITYWFYQSQATVPKSNATSLPTF